MANEVASVPPSVYSRVSPASAGVAATAGPMFVFAAVFSWKLRVAVGPSVNTGAVFTVVPVVVPDQSPSPAWVTARTCTSYCVPAVRPMIVYSRLPLVQASSTTVQALSSVSSSLVRI